MNSPIKQFLLKYPGIDYSSENNKELVGNVKIKDIRYRVKIICPCFPFAKDAKITVSTGLKIVSLTSEDFNSSLTLEDVLDELPTFCSPCNQNTEQSEFIYETNNEIIKLKSNFYKIYTNSQCTSIKFSNFDRFKEHYFQLELNNNKVFDLVEHSLPIGVQWEELFRTSNSIESYLTEFQKYLEELREFYTSLTDIDELCYVVQPENPTTKDNWRIIKLKDRVFVKVILDPFTSSPMAINLYGPTYEVESLRPILSEGLKNWDTEMDVHSNLLRTFELTYFPMASEDAGEYCNICYCYQLEGHVPIISCDSRSCSLVYHAICLKEWFTTLADGKVFLDVAFGACPFCKEKLSTSFADILR